MAFEFKDIETALADKPEAVAFVKGLADKAAKLTPELEAKLSTLPDLETRAAGLQKVLTEIKAENPDKLLEAFNNLKSVNADLVKRRKEGGGDVVDGADYRAQAEKLTTLEALVAELKKKSEDAEKSASQSAAEKRETDLKSSVITAAAKHKATDGEDIFIILKARGLVGYGEDGKPFFRKHNEKGEPVAVANAEEMITALKEKRKDLFMGSGVAGTGADHGGGAGGGGDAGPKNRREARSAFLASRAG